MSLAATLGSLVVVASGAHLFCLVAADPSAPPRLFAELRTPEQVSALTLFQVRPPPPLACCLDASEIRSGS